MSLYFQNSADQFYRFAGQFDELLFDLDEEDNNATLQSSQLQPDINDQLQKVSWKTEQCCCLSMKQISFSDVNARKVWPLSDYKCACKIACLGLSVIALNLTRKRSNIIFQ